MSLKLLKKYISFVLVGNLVKFIYEIFFTRIYMLSNKSFDKWAGEYDASIQRHSEGYPFEGYYDVLSYVRSLIKKPKRKNSCVFTCCFL